MPCNRMGEPCDISRCCSSADASCFRTYTNGGVFSASCQRTCIEPVSGRPCEVLTACAQPSAECSASGCCAAPAQRCFEKNRTFATCMPICQVGLHRFSDWSCLDRDGHSAAEAAALRLSHGATGPAHSVGAMQSDSSSTTQALMRTIFGGEVIDLAEALLGIDGKHLFVVLLTVAGVIVCCGLYIAGKLGRAACKCDRRRNPPPEKVLRSVRARARQQRETRQTQVAIEEPEDEQILGDEAADDFPRVESSRMHHSK